MTRKRTPFPDAIELDAAVALLAAMAHPARLTTLIALGRRGPLSVGELQALTGLEQSAMSHQLRVLRDTNLVVSEAQGKSRLYRLADRHVSHIVEDAIAHASER